MYGLGMPLPTPLLSIPEQTNMASSKSHARWEIFATRLKLNKSKSIETDGRTRTLGLVDLADGTGLGGDARHEGGGGDKELHLLWGWGWGVVLGLAYVPQEEENGRFSATKGSCCSWMDPFQRPTHVPARSSRFWRPAGFLRRRYCFRSFYRR